MKSLCWLCHLLVLMVFTSCLMSCGLLPKSQEVKQAEAESLQKKQERKYEMASRILSRLTLPLLMLSLICFTSCTSKPSFKAIPVTMPDGTTQMVRVPNLGGSLMTKKEIEYVRVKDAGLEVEYFAMDNDETVVPAKAVDSYTALGLASEATKALGTTPGVDKGKALVKGTKNPNVIPKDPNLPTMQIVPEGSVLGPR